MVDIDGTINSMSNGLNKASSGLSEASNSISNARDYLFDKAEDIGVKPFLSKNNTNRERTIQAEALLSSINSSIQRNYVLDGFADYKKTSPNTRNITTQTPQCIVLIKKKMFSSLSENFDPKYMDKDELHFYRASKKLFENKCFEISNFEKLTKLQQIVDGARSITTPIAQAIYDAVSNIEETEFNRSNDFFIDPLLPQDVWKHVQKNKDSIKKIKAALTLNGFSNTTTWVKNNRVEAKDEFGVGTGVIELTLVKSLNISNSIKLNGGSCSFAVSDPYNILFIDEVDIEKAIYDTSYKKFSITNYLADNLETETNQMKAELSALRVNRGASDVYYRVDISSKMYNNVIITLGAGYELTNKDSGKLDFETLDQGNYAPVERFQREEKKLIEKIYKNIFKILRLRNQNYQDFRRYNKDVNYVRKMMRLYYLGKHLIQPMDEVRVFIDSQTVEDGELDIFRNNLNDAAGTLIKDKTFLGAVSKTLNISNIPANINKTVGQIKDLCNTFNKTPTMTKSIMEKNVVVGKDFPIWLWNQLRPNFVANSFGTCSFCGVVDTVSESYSADGVYSLSVGCKDNSFYLSQGFVPSKPSLDQYDGHLKDPLTPFNFEFDKSTGLLPSVSQLDLLPENKKLLTDPNSKIRIQDGKNVGLKADLLNFNDSDFNSETAISQLNDAYADIVRKTYNPPDGFVYRWKSGIGTASVSQTGTYDGILSSKLNREDYGIVPVSANDMPFAGQDFINIVSILICGEPYNFNTFYKAALQYGSSSVNSSAFTNVDYYQSIFKRIKKLNPYWGNFLPFKKLSVDPDLFGAMLRMQATSVSQSTAIKQKQQKRAQLISKLMKIEGNNFFENYSGLFSGVDLKGQNRKITVKTDMYNITGAIILELASLDADIQMHEAMIRESFAATDSKSNIVSVANNIYFNEQSNFRLKQQEQNEVTTRKLWQCKANIDQNLFIVGSEYDNDFDIQALMTNINSDFDVFSSSWLNVADKIRNICDIVGFECFANTQGHIELRIPKYNRVPSSIIFDMFKKNEEYGVKIYPDFLEQTQKNRAEVLISKIEEIEDEIRLRAFALGGKWDPEDKGFAEVLGGSLSNVREFLFMTDGVTGNLNNLRKAINALDVKEKDDSLTSMVWDSDSPSFDELFLNNEDANVSNVFKVSKGTRNNFDILTQTRNFNKTYSDSNYRVPNESESEFATSAIRNRLASKKNIPVDQVANLKSLMPNSKDGKKSPIDIITVQSGLENLIKQRYECALQLTNIIKNIDSSARVSNSSNEVMGKLMFPHLYGTSGLPDFMMDMVEDESYDDLGYKSGKRYIIREQDIISMTYNQKNPDMTSLEISGSESGLSGVDLEFGGGAKFTQVTSVDFDMWRMFGYKHSSGKQYPFLTDVKSQLAPFALHLLNKERAEILQSTVTLRGNEFMQPGEVYFLEKRGMLFYCESVRHDFSYGGTFTTHLTLVMGHVPGEYIPTPLDIIGKNLYNSNAVNLGNVQIARSAIDASQSNLGVVISSYDIGLGGTGDAEDRIYSSDFGARNKDMIQNISGKVLYLLNKTLPTTAGATEGLTVRIYSDDADLKQSAEFVIKELINLGVPKEKIIGFDGAKQKSGIPYVVLPSNNKKIPEVRNPSTEAHAAANSIAIKYSSNDKISIINNYIIDIWLEGNLLLGEAQEIQSSEKSKENQKEVSTKKDSAFNNMHAEYIKYKNDNFKNSINIEQVQTTATTEVFEPETI